MRQALREPSALQGLQGQAAYPALPVRLQGLQERQASRDRTGGLRRIAGMRLR